MGVNDLPTKWPDFKIKSVEKKTKNYSKRLLDLNKPPELIYYRGNLKVTKKTLAVVGSRRMTGYGMHAMDKILPNLIDQGVTIISGFMYGVDTYAHSLAVEKKAPTIAVLGNGLNTCYPVENFDLYSSILNCDGAVISEYEPQAKPKPYMFVQRNRIIAAMSTIGVLVIEAGEKSGSLVTAKYAQELDRPLFAVPGQITSSVSSGTNWLIKQGKAKLVSSSEDILDSNTINKNIMKQENYNENEREIIELLKSEELTIDEISIKLNKNAQEIGTIITMLSMRGLLRESGGKFTLE